MAAAGAPAAPMSPSAAIASARVEPAEPKPTADPAADPTDNAAATPPPSDAPATEERKAEPPAAAEASKPMAAAAERKDSHDKAERSSRCRPGKYTGVINGTVTLTGLVDLGTMAGTVELELVPYQNRTDVLAVRKGRVEGVDDKRSRFTAEITGAVNCASGEVVKTSVDRGMFEDETLDVRVGFAGAAKGQYSMDPPALVGTWQISDETLLLTGEGTWSATMFEPY